MGNKVLIIDDNNLDRAMLKLYLKHNNYNVIEANNAEDGLKAILEQKPNCVLLDNIMAGGNGLTVLNALDTKNLNPPPVIFMSACIEEMTERKAKALGAMVCVDKSTMLPEQLLKEVSRCILHYYPEHVSANVHRA